MGAEPWQYVVPYEPSIEAALEKLRNAEFSAGRYRGSELNPRTIEEALENTGPDGTGSILDITRVSEEPDFCAVSLLPTETLQELYGTEQPTREMVEREMEFYGEIRRGQGVYVVLYEDGNPSEILFAGYSFD